MSIDATKPWYESTTIWAGIASILLGLGGALFGWAVTPSDSLALGAVLQQGAVTVFGGLAIFGRLRAHKKIG